MKHKELQKKKEKRFVQRVDDCFNSPLMKQEKNGAKICIALIGGYNTTKLS